MEHERGAEAVASVDSPAQWQTQDSKIVGDPQRDSLDTITYCNGSAQTRRVKKVKRKDESLVGALCAAIVQHQLGLAINCLLLLAFTHLFFPRLRPTTSQFFTFSYPVPGTNRYNPGYNDLKFVVFWIIVFTALRAATMDYFLIPYARWVGVEKKKAATRFAEQGWLLIYYVVFWTLGAYLVYDSQYFFNMPAMWYDFPTPSMTGLFKWYYLVQFAFWLQQIVVVNIEERRKDHWQMFTHHIITCCLIFGSYGNYQTKVGNVILCLMDVVDLILPVAKMLRYAGWQTACDIAFGIFIVLWFLARHVFYLAICWSLYHDMPIVMDFGCYNAVTGQKLPVDTSTVLGNVFHAYSGNPEAPVCFNNSLQMTFLTLLLALQVLTLVWFGMIVRVAWSVLSGNGADDSRSDDEGDEEDEMEHDYDYEDIKDFSSKEPLQQPQQAQHPQPREEEVGVQDLHYVRRQPSAKKSSRRSKGRASGISIPGHGDHKELLGRIGCDKPS